MRNLRDFDGVSAVRRFPVRTGLLLAALAVLGGATIVASLLLRDGRETGPGLVPEAIAPYGLVSRADLVFRWTAPSDRAPVRVEVFDPVRVPLWTSPPTTRGSLVPPSDSSESLPSGDLLWRPVAVSSDGSSRSGDLAAFTLAP